MALSVLWPPLRHLSGTESDANNNSVVLMARHGTVRVLLTGDLQQEGELALMGRSADLRADVLKVGHQGSADAAGAAFLARVRPAWAVVIAGRNNSYGHPSPATVERLQAAGATVLRTDLQGEIEFESDGRTIRPLRKEVPAAGRQAAGRGERKGTRRYHNACLPILCPAPAIGPRRVASAGFPARLFWRSSLAAWKPIRPSERS